MLSTTIVSPNDQTDCNEMPCVHGFVCIVSIEVFHRQTIPPPNDRVVGVAGARSNNWQSVLNPVVEKRDVEHVQRVGKKEKKVNNNINNITTSSSTASSSSSSSSASSRATATSSTLPFPTPRTDLLHCFSSRYHSSHTKSSRPTNSFEKM